MPWSLFPEKSPAPSRWIPESCDHKLLTLGQMLDLDEGQHHRAFSDAVWCWKVVEECLHCAEASGADPLSEAIYAIKRPLTIASRAPEVDRPSKGAVSGEGRGGAGSRGASIECAEYGVRHLANILLQRSSKVDNSDLRGHAKPSATWVCSRSQRE